MFDGGRGLREGSQVHCPFWPPRVGRQQGDAGPEEGRCRPPAPRPPAPSLGWRSRPLISGGPRPLQCPLPWSPPRRKLRAQLIESKAGGKGPPRGGRPPPLLRAPFPALGGISSAGIHNEPLINEAWAGPHPARAPASAGGGGDGGKRSPGRKGGGAGARGPPPQGPLPLAVRAVRRGARRQCGRRGGAAAPCVPA